MHQIDLCWTGHTTFGAQTGDTLKGDIQGTVLEVRDQLVPPMCTPETALGRRVEGVLLPMSDEMVHGKNQSMWLHPKRVARDDQMHK